MRRFIEKPREKQHKNSSQLDARTLSLTYVAALLKNPTSDPTSDTNSFLRRNRQRNLQRFLRQILVVSDVGTIGGYAVEYWDRFRRRKLLGSYQDPHRIRLCFFFFYVSMILNLLSAMNTVYTIFTMYENLSGGQFISHIPKTIIYSVPKTLLEPDYFILRFVTGTKMCTH